MSKIQRYHTNEYGDLVKSNASYAKLCKYEDVKHLERKLAEARELLISIDEYLGESGVNAVCSTSIYHRQIQDLIKQLKEKGDETR